MRNINYKGYQIQISQDEYLEDSPRDWDNFGTINCWHHDYNLGEKHDYSTPIDFEKDITKGNYIILPVYIFDHSGITINTTGFSCPWDSGQVGYIYVSKEKVRERFNKKRISKQLVKKVKSILIDEIKTYDQYLTNDVYGYEIINKEQQLIDSCYGFFGHIWSENGLINQARASIDYHINNQKGGETK